MCWSGIPLPWQPCLQSGSRIRIEWELIIKVQDHSIKGWMVDWLISCSALEKNLRACYCSVRRVYFLSPAFSAVEW